MRGESFTQHDTADRQDFEPLHKARPHAVRLKQDALILKRHLALVMCCCIAFAKNRFPLFRAMH
jgi:hypothetical protein